MTKGENHGFCYSITSTSVYDSDVNLYGHLSCLMNSMKHKIKTYNASIMIVLTILMVSTASAEWEQHEPAADVVDRYRQRIEDSKEHLINSNTRTEMEARAKAIHEYTTSTEFESTIEANKVRLQLAYPELFGEAPEAIRDKIEKPEYEGDRVFIFISSSIPVETLRNYVIDLQQLPQATAVLKGFVGGVKKMQPTIQFIGDLMKEDRECKIPDCDFRPVSIVVDPIIYERLKIDRVPAIAYIENYERTGYCSEGLDDGARMDNIHIVYGDVPLKYALEYINRKNPSEKLKSMISKIKT